jgi:hypothetical protein
MPITYQKLTKNVSHIEEIIALGMSENRVLIRDVDQNETDGEAGENCTVSSFISCTIHQIMICYH